MPSSSSGRGDSLGRSGDARACSGVELGHSSDAPGLLRVAVCQINPTVGDLDANAALIAAALSRAEAGGADVAVFGELALTGYSPEDLVFRPGFVSEVRATLEQLAAQTRDCAAVVGFVDGAGEQSRRVPDMAGVDNFNRAYNAAAVCAAGEVRGVCRKRHLPNYGVFDEMRHFSVDAQPSALFEVGGALVGVTICEDAWVPDGPVSDLAQAGAQVVLNINGSPFRVDKQAAREQVIGLRSAAAGVSVVCVNLVGGQDELVFDGGSFVVGASGETLARCASFAESVDVFDVELRPRRAAAVSGSQASTGQTAAPASSGTPPATQQPCMSSDTATSSGPVSTGQTAAPASSGTPSAADASIATGRSVVSVTRTSSLQRSPERIAAPLVPLLDCQAQRWAALTLATRDYVHKSGFSDVCLGLSGGVDSSLTAAIAAEALGAGHVHGVLMPSRNSSGHSLQDAEKLAVNLGIDARIVGIEPAHAALAEMLEPALGDRLAPGCLTDQNLQARVRGTTLMALANENGWLVLTTGNKSELAAGYSTLYGDTAGAFAVISDLWKLEVYQLCVWRNQQAGREIVPGAVLTKAPSAELAPGQRDDQSLPPYEVLDPILRAYVEELRSIPEIQQTQPAAAEVVERVCRMVDAAEYKRRQTPIGPRLTARAFGRDRRMPIISRYRSLGVS